MYVCMYVCMYARPRARVLTNFVHDAIFRYEESRGNLAEASRLIRDSHGSNSVAYRQVERMLDEVLMVMQKVGGYS